MRGIRAYNELFAKETTTTSKPKKGRNNDLIQQRDELLSARFYYYSKRRGLRYEEVIIKLSNEFFLSESRVITIIGARPSSTHKAFENWTIKDFENKYDFLTWKN